MKRATALLALSTVLAIASTSAADEPPPRPRGALSAHARASWVHAWVFGVPLDFADVEAAIGGSIGRELTLDVLGTFGVQAGRTDAGRTLSGFTPLGLEMRLRYGWLRASGGARVGVLGVTRSTDDGWQHHPFGDAWLGLGAEPVALGARGALFVDARLHTMAWDAATLRGFSIGAGARF